MTGYLGTRWSIVKPCGTEAAYRRHYRRGQKPCQRCIDAHRLAVEEREQRRAVRDFVPWSAERKW